jgi:hypothetical protein
MLKFFKSFFNKQKPIEIPKHMEIFSHDYKDKLIAEHRLISAAIAHATQPNVFANAARTHSNDICVEAVKSLRVQKVQLEFKIDVLSEYLD